MVYKVFTVDNCGIRKWQYIYTGKVDAKRVRRKWQELGMTKVMVRKA